MNKSSEISLIWYLHLKSLGSVERCGGAIFNINLSEDCSTPSGEKNIYMSYCGVCLSNAAIIREFTELFKFTISRTNCCLL